MTIAATIWFGSEHGFLGGKLRNTCLPLYHRSRIFFFVISFWYWLKCKDTVTYTSSVRYLSAWTGVSDSLLGYLFINEKVEERQESLPLAEPGRREAAEEWRAVPAERKSISGGCSLHPPVLMTPLTLRADFVSHLGTENSLVLVAGWTQRALPCLKPCCLRHHAAASEPGHRHPRILKPLYKSLR